MACTCSEPGSVEVLIRRLDPDLPMPRCAHPGDAGSDLYLTADVNVQPGERVTVGTGVCIALPDGYAGFVHPRSGLAARHGLTIADAPGTVDAGYRGEIKVILLNTDAEHSVQLYRGDRIARLVIQKIERPFWREVVTLPGSQRGGRDHGWTEGHAMGGESSGDN